MTVVSSLWIGDRLSPLERACVRSFLNKGHEFNLYAYGPIDNVPQGCRVLDAATILPESSIFTYSRGPGKGSVAAFSNLFRYKLLYELGGWWVDMDMFCLSPALPDCGVVLAREDKDSVNCAVMRFPRGHEALRAACEECIARGDDVDWGDTGPRLLTRLAADFALTDCTFPESAFYPIHFSQCWVMLDPRRTAYAAERIRGAACIHLWNNVLGRMKFDKHVLPPDGSLLRNLYEWTIGTDGFTQEYVLAASCKPEVFDLQVIPRQAGG